MPDTTLTTATTPATPDLAALKGRQQAAWSSGNYAVVGTTLQIVGEQLCEAMDLRAGATVLDVAELSPSVDWPGSTSDGFASSDIDGGSGGVKPSGLNDNTDAVPFSAKR